MPDDKKSRGRLVQTRNDLLADREDGVVRWAEALLEERRRNSGAPIAFPAPPEGYDSHAPAFDHAHQLYYLELLAATDSKSAAAYICGFTPGTVDKYRKSDADFDKAASLMLWGVKGYRRFRTRHELERRGIKGFNPRPLVDKDGAYIRDPETDEVIWHHQYSDSALSKLVDLDFREDLKSDAALVDVNIQTGVVRLGPRSKSTEEFDKEFGDLKSPQVTDADFEVEE